MDKMRRFCVDHQKALLIASLALYSVVVLSIAIQLLYPSNRTYPGQRIGGTKVGFKSSDQLKDQLQKTEQEATLQLKLDDEQVSAKWIDMGVSIDQSATLNQAFKYPWWQKIIPFSGIFRSVNRDTAVVPKVDDTKLQTYAEKLSKDHYKNPANATLSISGTQVVRNPQKSGSKYDPSSVISQIKSVPYTRGSSVKLSRVEVPPIYSQSDIEEVAKKAEAIIASELKVDAAGSTQTIPQTEVAGWLKFSESSDAQHIKLDIDKEKVKTYLNQLNKSVYKAPGSMTITLRDGTEIARSADTSGQSLDIDNGANVLATGALTAQPTVHKVPVIKLAAKITYQRSYTRSQAGMNALINDLASENGDMAITFRALDGSGIAASAKGSKQYMPASTYKLMVAYSAIKRIEAGQMQWSDNVNGRNVDKCISDMIVLSDNPCGSALGDKIGWQAVTDDARAIGMGRTNLAKGFLSTTDDQATFLTKLEQGSLMNGANRDKLLSLMKQQRYRSGIPAGASGSVVADKVGFINSLLHDSAIVYGPRGIYVLSIYSNGSSWAKLASVTARIHGLMNQ